MCKKDLKKTMKDENSDLKKQIGCISGFFQLFERNRFLTDQSQSQNSSPTIGPGGTINHIKDKNNTMQKAPVNNVMVAKEIQQFSTESSGTSISSSSCSSSMSSLEFNRTIPIEQPSIFPTKIAENINAGAAMKQLDFYDVVKGSMHRESKGLAVKTTAIDEKKRRVLKFIDSPRPLQLHKSVNRALDSPRLSYDGRDMHDSLKSCTKHKELPRLSLDSRQGSFNGVNEGTKCNNHLKGPNKGYGGTSTMVKQLQESETHRRSSSSSIVAKLMGLEGFEGMAQTCDASQDSQLQASKGSDSSIKASNPVLSVYGEIEKRMANLEFKNSGKDLRALKQILDAMQRYKDTLDVTGDQASNSPSHSRSNSTFSESSKVHSPRIRQKDPTSTIAEKSYPNNARKSPIVIMKPAKVTRETNNLVNHKNGRLFEKNDGQKSNGMSPKRRHDKDSFSESFHSADKSNKMRTSKLMQSSKVPQVINGVNTIKSSNTAEIRSPRLQKKFGFERRSPPTSPSSDSSSNRRQHNRPSLELNSTSTSPRQKFSTLHERNDHFSERRMDSHSDIVATHVDHSEKSNITFNHPNGLNQNNATKEFSIDSVMAEKIVTAEQPSPVSVLDAAFYIEDPPSPVKKKPNISKDLGEALNAYDSSEESSEDLQQIQYNNEKLSNISDIMDPDHEYISEILLVSGLLSNAGFSQAVNSSAHPINPKLFLALEQMKTSKFYFNNPEKMQRKLIFDVLNDILVQKLILETSSTPWSFPNLPTRRKLQGQRLLEEICSEINQLQHKDRNVSQANEDQYLTNLLWEDLMHQSTICTETRSEIPNVVLDIERLIFKDLITEVVKGEVSNYPGRHCRQT